MCGICGWAGRAPDAARLRAAMLAIEHRGPDQEGKWAGEGVMLGHRRLAILDLSEDGRQPLANDAGTVQIAFNGEIYNFRELRAQLEGRYRFRSRSDTEVLVHGYEEWGIEGLLTRISGMYAFALWDAAREVLHVARDPVGKKPLFYSLRDGLFAFASSLPSLLALLPVRPDVRPRAVQDFLQYLCVPGDESIVEGVHKLLPGHRAEFRGGGLSVHRHWVLRHDRQEHRSEAEWLERIDIEVRRAVEARLVSDVPVGVFLSGGVDSSLVTAIMAELSPGRVTTISAGFTERSHDELEHARTVAEWLATDHHEHVIRPDAMSVLPWLVHSAGEPFADPAVLPTLLLSRAARQHVSVVLTGDGGDEGFAGYAGPMIARLASPYRALVPDALRRSAIPGRLKALSNLPGKPGWVARQLRRIAVPAGGGDGLAWRYDALGERGFRGRWAGLFTDAFATELGGHRPDAYWDEVFAAADGPTDADRVLLTEMATLLPDQFLVKTDVATMAYGLEARSPLLDVGVLELAARIPVARKLGRFQSKRLLKRLAERYVPREVIYRRKQGFSVPLGSWLRGDLGQVMKEVLCSDAAVSRGIFRPDAIRLLVESHQLGREDHGQRLWTLLMLELWFRVVMDRSIAPTDDFSAALAQAGHTT